jgi:hypothetical protein
MHDLVDKPAVGSAELLQRTTAQNIPSRATRPVQSQLA